MNFYLRVQVARVARAKAAKAVDNKEGREDKAAQEAGQTVRVALRRVGSNCSNFAYWERRERDARGVCLLVEMDS